MQATENNKGGTVKIRRPVQNSAPQENKNLSPCPHRYAGCINQNGYMCLHDKSCEPIDAAGRRFTVSYSVEDGQTYMIRTYMIRTYERKAGAAIASTPFADAEPFNPAKFVSDRVGS